MLNAIFALATLAAAAPCPKSPPAGGAVVCCTAACSGDSKDDTKDASFLIARISVPKPATNAPAKHNTPAPKPKASPSTNPNAACAALDTALTAGSPKAATPPQDDADPPKSDADRAIELLGNPSPLTLKASGKSTILVYSSTLDTRLYRPALNKVTEWVKKLPASEPTPAKNVRKIEIAVPLSSTADTFSSLDKKFTVTLEYPGKLQIAGDSQLSCGEWLAILDSVGSSSIGAGKEPRVSRLFYLQPAAETATAIGGSGSGTGNPQAKDAQKKSDAGSDATKAAQGDTSDDSAKGSDDPPDPSKAGSATKKTSKKTSSDPSTPTATADSSSPKQPAKTSSKDADAPGGNFSVQSLEPDMLIFGGDDEKKIRAAKQVLAMLDLPRPEMIINAWVLQISTNNANQVGEFDQIARKFVAQNNDVLQRGIQAGWIYLRSRIDQGNYFDQDFYAYLTKRYIADVGDLSGATPQAASTDEQHNRENRGICPRGQYCLGYTTLFNPLQPRLTDLLLAMIASRDPEASKAAINMAENVPPTLDSPAAHPGDETHYPPRPEYKRCDSAQCEELRQRLGLKLPLCKANCKSGSGGNGSNAMETPSSACGVRDLNRLIDSAGDQFLNGQPPQLQLECFRQAIEDMTWISDEQVSKASGERVSRTQALARAALADFLFNYKNSQQYPSEFSTYDLAMSADTFNTALGPFTDAFNRDIASYQEYLNNVVSMAEDCKPNRNVTFTNSGLVSVRTVSSNPTKVSSTTQSFLDASTFPELGTLAGNIAGAQSGSGKTSAVSGALANLTPIEAQVLTGALKSFQSSQAQIGRAINLKVSPRSLSGASSAEMDVTLNIDEQGTPTRYTGTSSDKFNLSRVATHDTVTHIRVDSLKLFEVSAVSAKLTLSRPPIPLVLPGVELPYIGSIVGLPRKPAEEYHSSVAIMSAIVVPTAADLASGLRFVDDRIVVAPPGLCMRPWQPRAPNDLPYCKTGAAAAQSQLEGSIRAFHLIRKQCIATGGQDAYGVIPTGHPAELCGQDGLTFDQLAPVFRRAQPL
jgi:hypothetical protein